MGMPLPPADYYRIYNDSALPRSHDARMLRQLFVSDGCGGARREAARYRRTGLPRDEEVVLAWGGYKHGLG